MSAILTGPGLLATSADIAMPAKSVYSQDPTTYLVQLLWWRQEQASQASATGSESGPAGATSSQTSGGSVPPDVPPTEHYSLMFACVRRCSHPGKH
jgi:hypothetical protein